MIRGAHHGGDFRHGDAEFLLGEDSENIIRLQGEGNTQLFQHDVIIHPAFDRQRRRGRIFTAFVVNQAVEEIRQHDIRAAHKPLFVFFFQPGNQLFRADRRIRQGKNTNQAAVIGFQGVAQATENIVTDHIAFMMKKSAAKSITIPPFYSPIASFRLFR